MTYLRMIPPAAKISSNGKVNRKGNISGAQCRSFGKAAPSPIQPRRTPHSWSGANWPVKELSQLAPWVRPSKTQPPRPPILLIPYRA